MHRAPRLPARASGRRRHAHRRGGQLGRRHAVVLARGLRARLAAVVVSCYITSWRHVGGPGPAGCRADPSGLPLPRPRLRGLRDRRRAPRLSREQRHQGLLPHRRLARRLCRTARLYAALGAVDGWLASRTTTRTAGRSRSAKGRTARSAPGSAPRVSNAPRRRSRPNPSEAALRVTTGVSWRRRAARAPCAPSTPTRRACWPASAPPVTDGASVRCSAPVGRARGRGGRAHRQRPRAAQVNA